MKLTNLLTALAAAVMLTACTGAATTNDKTMKTDEFIQIFPQGEKMPEQYSKYFIGQAYRYGLTSDGELNVPAANVTFEPGCRNNWHSHTGGQLLIVTAGRGFYQEKDSPARELRPGDVVEIRPNVVHWHGAAPDSWFSHIAVECNPQTNVNTWLEPVNDQEYAEATGSKAVSLNGAQKWLGGEASALSENDPELDAIFSNFAYGEAMEQGSLDMRTRVLITLASNIATQAEAEYKLTMNAALANGISPDEIKEVLYHAVPYAGMAKVRDFVQITNDFLTEKGVKLPLANKAAVTAGDRYDKGLALQVSIFGDGIHKGDAAAPADQKHIRRFLSANCFGDYQTRSCLSVRERELLTFAILVSQGGCEPQAKGHIAGNLAVGNDRATLVAAATQLLPYIGYPRTLNALGCINEVCK